MRYFVFVLHQIFVQRSPATMNLKWCQLLYQQQTDVDSAIVLIFVLVIDLYAKNCCQGFWSD